MGRLRLTVVLQRVSSCCNRFNRRHFDGFPEKRFSQRHPAANRILRRDLCTVQGCLSLPLVARTVEVFTALKPLLDFLNAVVLPSHGVDQKTQ